MLHPFENLAHLLGATIVEGESRENVAAVFRSCVAYGWASDRATQCVVEIGLKRGFVITGPGSLKSWNRSEIDRLPVGRVIFQGRRM